MYEDLLKERGAVYLHELLKQKDPESAEILHPNDTKRVIRALEIFDVTGRKKSEQRDKPVPRFDFCSVSVDFPRETLYGRIDLRVEKMFLEGLKEEVKNLLVQGVTEDMQCMQGIGYKEVAEGMKDGLCDEEIKENVKKNTCNMRKDSSHFSNVCRIIPSFPRSGDGERGFETIIKLCQTYYMCLT